MTKKLFTRHSPIPGSPYTPSNTELLKSLGRRVQRGIQSSVITDIENMYEKEPWLLEHVRHVKFNKNEWFYFVTRKKLGSVNKADSKRVSRKVQGSGRWKTNGYLKIIEDEDGVEIGSYQTASFLVMNGKKENSTGWVMHEFLLNETGFQEVALCRLKFNPNNNAQYAPRFQPRMIGLPQETPEEDGQGIQNQTQVPMMIDHALNGPYSTQPADMMQHGYFGSFGYYVGESSSHQPNQASLMKQPQWNGYPGPSSAQPYYHGMMQHQIYTSSGQFAGDQFSVQATHPFSMEQPYEQGMMESIRSSTPSLAQSLGPYSDLSVVHMDTTQGSLMKQQQWNGYPSPYSDQRTMQQNLTSCQVIGDMARYQNQYSGHQMDPTWQVPMMSQASNGPSSAQPYDQSMMIEHLGTSTPCLAQPLGPSNDLSVAPMETTQGMVHENTRFDHNAGNTSSSLAQAHDPQYTNNVESSELTEDDLNYLDNIIDSSELGGDMDISDRDLPLFNAITKELSRIMQP